MGVRASCNSQLLQLSRAHFLCPMGHSYLLNFNVLFDAFRGAFWRRTTGTIMAAVIRPSSLYGTWNQPSLSYESDMRSLLADK